MARGVKPGLTSRIFLQADDLSCASPDSIPETPVPALTAREVYQPLRDAAQGIRTFQRVDDAGESGDVRVEIDGWQLTLEVLSLIHI